jgi:DNA-binding NtrC family response regulator
VAAWRAERLRARADVHVLDVRLPDGSGIDVLRELRQEDDRSAVVMISGHGTIRDAVEATRIGAFDFLEKPLARDRVLLVVKNALEWADLQRENQRFRELVGEAPRMIGAAPVFQQAVQQATRVARSDVTVLLSGESGTGKELLAAHIHRESPVSAGPFVKVNCAAIPTELIESELFGHEKGAFTGAATSRRGKFELAEGGTIFLDEIGDLHEASQAKLLRILQDGELQRVGGERSIRVATRVVAATNRQLDELVANARFRQDLYYRLSVVPIRVPPLRERLQDVAELVPYFLSEFCARNNFRARTIDPDVVPQLERYAWPGNVRELRNVLERALTVCPSDLIGVGHLPSPPAATAAAEPASEHETADVHLRVGTTVDEAERRLILRTLAHTGNNKTRAAEILGISLKTLHNKLNRYNRSP